MTDKRYKLGIRITVGYLLVLGIYVFVQRGPVMAMEPNEFGDFLAGAASPLAFLWLVLGYLQQGDELSQNTAALTLQAKELRDSVEQQKALVDATRLQHEFQLDRVKEQRRLDFLATQPVFDMSINRSKIADQFDVALTNTGRACSRLSVIFSEDDPLFESEEDYHSIFPPGSTRRWTLSLDRSYLGKVLSGVIEYIDFHGDVQEHNFNLKVFESRAGATLCFLPSIPRQVFPWPDETATS